MMPLSERTPGLPASRPMEPSMDSREALRSVCRHAVGPVAVVCGMNFNGLGVARSLGRRRIPVFGMDHALNNPGMRSRYCIPVPCPPPAQPEEYVAALRRIGELARDAGGTKAVLFATGDDLVALIARHSERLSEAFELTVPGLSIVQCMLDKAVFARCLSRFGLPSPLTCFPETEGDLKAFCSKARFPCILKPCSSGPFNDRFGKAVEVGNEPDLMEAFAATKEAGFSVIAQEAIPGEDTNLHLVTAGYGRDGRLLGAFTFRRVRQYPRRYGNGAMCVGTDEPGLVELCNAFVKATGYHGIIDAEFKRDARDGTFQFIEINPRTGWQNALATACGVNVPWLVYQEAAGRRPRTVRNSRVGAKWVFLRNDIQAAKEEMRDDGLTLWSYVKSFRGVRAFAVFAWDDPRPFAESLIRLFARPWKLLWRALAGRRGRSPRPL
jgi:D-aspartate ligase